MIQFRKAKALMQFQCSNQRERRFILTYQPDNERVYKQSGLADFWEIRNVENSNMGPYLGLLCVDLHVDDCFLPLIFCFRANIILPPPRFGVIVEMDHKVSILSIYSLKFFKFNQFTHSVSLTVWSSVK